MLAFLLFAALLGSGPQDGPQTEAADSPRLTRVADPDAVGRCMGALVGFSNVGLRCTVASDGTLRQCEILTANPRVLRYRDRFECMAAATRVYEADGSPATGRVVQLVFHGSSEFSNPRRQ
jgi:hypothetical protein